MSKCDMDSISFGCYTANDDDDVLRMRKNVNTKDNYVYCTGFFGIQV